MIDWEDLAQRQVAEIQRALPESIRARATEVPVFFSRERKGRACLGVFEGYSLLNGPPTQPDQMPRITLFLDTLAQAANYRERVFLQEVRITYLHELGHYVGWDEEQIANAGLGKGVRNPYEITAWVLSPRIATPLKQFRSRMRAQWRQEMNPVPGASGESERWDPKEFNHKCPLL